MVSGTRDNPLPELPWARYVFTKILERSDQPFIWVYMIPPELSRGASQLGWASCLFSAGRVTLAGGTTFSHINTLARLPGTTHGVPRFRYFGNFRFKSTNLRYKGRINSTKSTLIE